MQTKLTVTLIANAGLLLECQQKRILLDGLFDGKHTMFSAPPPEIIQEMLEGHGHFAHIDYLLITHDHPDHVAPSLLTEYLNIRTPKCVLLPLEMLAKYKDLKDTIYHRKIACLPLGRMSANMKLRLTPESYIQPISTSHLDKAFKDVSHFCYLLNCCGKNILFTADVDYTQETFLELKHVSLSAVFLNPLFYHSRNDPVHCASHLQPEHFCVYHVPTSAEATYTMVPMLRTDTTCADIHTWILDTPMQEIVLE